MPVSVHKKSTHPSQGGLETAVPSEPLKKNRTSVGIVIN